MESSLAKVEAEAWGVLREIVESSKAVVAALEPDFYSKVPSDTAEVVAGVTATFIGLWYGNKICDEDSMSRLIAAMSPQMSFRAKTSMLAFMQMFMNTEGEMDMPTRFQFAGLFVRNVIEADEGVIDSISVWIGHSVLECGRALERLLPSTDHGGIVGPIRANVLYRDFGTAAMPDSLFIPTPFGEFLEVVVVGPHQVGFQVGLSDGATLVFAPEEPVQVFDLRAIRSKFPHRTFEAFRFQAKHPKALKPGLMLTMTKNPMDPIKLWDNETEGANSEG